MLWRSYRRRRTQEQSFRRRQIHSIVALLCRAIKGIAGTYVPVAGFLPLARNLRTVRSFRCLLLQDRLLSEIDEKLPLAGHVPGTFQQLNLVKGLFAAGFLMGTQEIVVRNPEGYAVAGSVFRAVAAGDAVRLLKGAVQPFNDLFERTELFGYLIVIGQAEHLGDEDIPVFFQLKLLSSKGIGTVSIGNELQCLAGEFLKFIKSHAHREDTGADISGGRDLIAEDGAGHFIHNEPDIGFHAADLDIGFISHELVRGLIIIGIHKGTDNDRSCFCIVIDHGMGNLDPVDLFESLYRLAQGELQVYPVRETQPHDIGIVFLVFERGSPFRELV